jgi:hypothetical protein
MILDTITSRIARRLYWCMLYIVCTQYTHFLQYPLTKTSYKLFISTLFKCLTLYCLDWTSNKSNISHELMYIHTYNLSTYRLENITREPLNTTRALFTAWNALTNPNSCPVAIGSSSTTRSSTGSAE